MLLCCHYYTGTAHRAHSSTAGVTKHMKLNAAGYLMEKELDYLQKAVDEPKRPLVAILGGAKVSTKIPVLEALIDKCDSILIGGGMMFTFYKAQGYDIGKSMVEEDMVEMAKRIMDKAHDKGVSLILPSDVVVADKFDATAQTKVVPVSELGGDWMGLDIGPQSLALFAQSIALGETIVWNGPMGVFEMEPFAEGTRKIAQMLAEATSERGAVTIVGGGDSVAAINQAGLGDKVSHLSTGGGASMELLEGKELPGVAALTDV
jgi:phosphoglycerate kinase